MPFDISAGGIYNLPFPFSDLSAEMEQRVLGWRTCYSLIEGLAETI
ncbi:MAG: hypothetical protein K1X65_10980 [Caldilineales bacterium]|nr:hypothetical protein [Caldilineales bacterium]MCW5856731.1 hypothetical protein [Caldilineales bacterium]